METRSNDPYTNLIRRIAESKGEVRNVVARLFAPVRIDVIPVDNRPDTRDVVRVKRRRIKK